jgi:parallel beta-helix repeat protein
MAEKYKLNVGRKFLALLILPTILLGGIGTPEMDQAEAAGGEYFVATDGDDNKPGTISQPWRTIAKANRTLQAGDTLYIRGGTYNEIIEPFNSGTPENKITYTNYQDEEVILRGEPDAAPVISIGWSIHGSGWGEKGYIVIDGFTIRHVIPSDQMSENSTVGVRIWGENTHHIEVRNCKIYGDPQVPRQYGISIGKSSHNIIENNTIDGVTRVGIIVGGGGNETDEYNIIRDNVVLNSWNSHIDVGGGCSEEGNRHKLLIENNILGNSIIEDGIQFEYCESQDWGDHASREVIIRSNVIFGNAENGIDLKSAADIVIDGNIFYGNIGDNDGFEGDNSHDRGGGFGAIHTGAYLHAGSRDIIIRNNVIYDNFGGVLIYNGYKIYNNTIVGNNRDYTGSNSTYESDRKPYMTSTALYGTGRLTDLGFKNNIIGEHNHGELAVQSTDPNLELDIDNNLYFNTQSVLMVDFRDNYDWDELSFADWQIHLQGQIGVVGADENSLVSDPLFVNAPSRPVGDHSQFDFHLQSDSPGIEAGAFLTRTTSSGSGTQIPVNEAGYFTNGYGITDGDLIQLEGQTQTARITNVDYENDIITVDTPLSWSSGQGVSLPYFGNKPDIGAYEFSDTPTPTFADVPLDYWAYDYIVSLYEEGYISGCATGPERIFCPQNSMKRSESSVFVVRGLHPDVSGYLPLTPTAQYFEDVLIGEGEEWFSKWVGELFEQGFTSGCSTTPPHFCPLNDHSRAEATVFYLRMLHGVDFIPAEPTSQTFNDVTLDKWYAPWVQAAYEANLIQPCQTDMENMLFRPEEDLTRAEAACMMFQALSIPK